MTVRTAVPSGVYCEAQYVAPSDAWEFVAFALGGTAPEFADTVTLLVSGSMARSFVERRARPTGSVGARRST